MGRFRARFTLAGIGALTLALVPGPPALAEHVHIECQYSRSLCTEVEDPSVFGYYVGHDEPSTLLLTDDHQQVDFYPFFSAATGYGAACAWALGNDIPGHTVNDFGGVAQYGPLLRLTYPLFGGLGATSGRFNDFRQVLDSNPCVR